MANKQRTEQIEGLPVVRRNVCGVDLGSETHWVCAPTVDGSAREVTDFGATTAELIRMAEWLKERKVASVAMESTGVYWIAPFEILEGQGLEVLLVDTRQLGRVPGRDKKTDPTDCEWIQRLHSCGLLRGCFRPAEAICMLRTLLRDKRCHKTEEEIAEQLSGHWREDHLFSLKQGLKMYDAIEKQIAEYDREILQRLEAMQRDDLRGQSPPPLQSKEKAKAIRKRGEEKTRDALYRISGVDMVAIDGIGVETVQIVLSEYGFDLSRFPTEKEFIQHLRLAPYSPKTGGKPINKKRRQNTASTRVGNALRMAAVAVGHSNTALGAQYRNTARRKGAGIAAFATARRMAVLIYRLLRWGQQYLDEGVEAFERRYQQNRLLSLIARAKQLGYQMIPNTTIAAEGVTG